MEVVNDYNLLVCFMITVIVTAIIFILPYFSIGRRQKKAHESIELYVAYASVPKANRILIIAHLLLHAQQRMIKLLEQEIEKSPIKAQINNIPWILDEIRITQGITFKLLTEREQFTENSTSILPYVKKTSGN